MFPDDDIRETIINYADGAGEENTVKFKTKKITGKIVGVDYLSLKKSNMNCEIKKRYFKSKLAQKISLF